MAQLFITYKSQDYAELELEEQQEYLIGRSKDADIPLEGEHSLSRKHSSLYFQSGSWIIKKISQSGQLFYKNEEVVEQVLEDKSVFIIENFAFVLKLTSPEEASDSEENKGEDGSGDGDKSEEENSINKKETAKKDQQIRSEEDQQLQPEEEEEEKKNNNLNEFENADIIKSENDTSEYTAIIKTNLTVQLNIYKPKQKLPESVNLTKNSWVVGRAKDCDTSIKYLKLSRYHFEITKDSSGYWITDLGSINGTRLNGNKLKKNESQELKHDDNIAVKKLKITFEVINKNYKDLQLSPIDEGMALELDNKPTGLLVFLPQSKEKRYLYIGVIFIVIMIVLFSLDEKKAPPKNATKINKLKPEQLQLLKDNLYLARTHYIQKKYQLCLSTLKRINVSSYEVDKVTELRRRCNQDYQLKQEQEERKRQVKVKEKLNDKIISIVEKCKNKFTSENISNEQIKFCLYPAIEINPNHPGIIDLISLAESKNMQRANVAAETLQNNQSYSVGLRKYQKALRLYKKNKLRASIKSFQKFLNSSHYGIHSLKVKAKKNLQKAKKQFDALINNSLSKCKNALNKKEYKKAAPFCKKALQQDPENTKASNLLKSVLQKSRKELKEIYKNSIFEESVGSIALAKTMWNNMLSKGVPGEEYYEKANRKLQKYEGL